jgi:DsbC/DsbD-like thiol-disulfide interchange protein/cytochrome c biogenesis protein CcdA
MAFANPVQREHTRLELIAESQSIAPGQSLSLAIRMTPNEGWHTYYKNYGDTGLETTATWTLPTGFSASALEYPVPVRIAMADIMNFGYKSTSTLLLKLRAPEKIPNSVLPVSVQLNYLVCSDEICVPEAATLALQLRKGNGAPDASRTAFFADARAAMPKPMTWPARYGANKDNFKLVVDIGEDLPAFEEVLFYPTQMGVMANSPIQKVIYSNGKLQIITGGALENMPPVQLDGVLTFKTKGSDLLEGFTINAAYDAKLLNEKTDTTPSILAALAFALLGGLLLNLMPCVFPILSLKALAIAKSSGTAVRAQRDALWYSVGVIATFLLLASVLFALRTAGQSIGWGFQLQDPRVVGGLALLMVAVALNLFGVFDVSTRLSGAGQNLTEKSGSSGAFWTGALAVLVATPCTAPFMAGALGAAFLLPPLIGLLIFAFLGLGMALPFLLLGYVPALRRWLPKPGAWMATFKILLGFPMLLTALWLVWVVGQQAGIDMIFKLLAAALLLSFGLWMFGTQRNIFVRVLAVLCIIGSIIVPLRFGSTQGKSSSSLHLAGEAYSDAALAKARSSGKPVFVYFTADWCISCKVNERSTLSNTNVQQAFKSAGATILVGDWTKRDDNITRALARYGRSGVPLYLWFPNEKAEAQILPQLLSPDMVKAVINPK